MQIFTRRADLGWRLVGLLGLVLVWQFYALRLPTIILPTPAETLRALAALASTGYLWAELAVTLRRLALALLLGSGLGLAAGLAGGLVPAVREMLKPLTGALMGTPPIALVVLALVWFGTGDTGPLVVTALIIFPLVFAHIVEGILALDQRLVQMVRLYRAPFSIRVQDLYLPGIAGPLLASAQVVTGMGVRVGIMAELLGSPSGIGSAMAMARVNLMMPELFAWIVVSVTLVLALELALGPVRRSLLAWRGDERAQR